MSSLDYLDLCRLCLVKDRVSVPIFDGEGDVRQIFLKIAACLPVKVAREDKLPKKICDDCVYKVELFYQFWNTTANAEKQLLQWLGDVGLEEKQGYVSEVLSSEIMKQEESENRLDVSVMQATGEHTDNMAINIIDDMNLGIPIIMSTDQQITVPINSNNNVQTGQSVPGPSARSTHDQVTPKSAVHDAEEDTSEDDNTDDDCDADEGLAVKEEGEDTTSGNRAIEPTTFVNVALACDEAGPSGLQQQKLVEMPTMGIQQSSEGDPKSGSNLPESTNQNFLSVKLGNDYSRIPKSLAMFMTKESTRNNQRHQKIDKLSEINTIGKHLAVISKTNEEVDQNNINVVMNSSSDNDDIPLSQRYKKLSGITLRSSRLENKMYTCPICNIIFDRKNKLEIHLIKHNDSTSYRCDACSKSFKTHSNMMRHMEFHCEPKQIYTCNVCNFKARCKPHLMIHYMRRHADEYKFSCEHCGKMFKLESDQIIHMKVHETESCVCGVCDNCHLKENSPYYHHHNHHRRRQYKHSTRKKNYECKTCKKRFSTMKNLKSHGKLHEMKYICEQCGMEFKRRYGLTKHMRTHSAEKKCLCAVCGKTFKSLSAQKVHLLTHVGERPYVCDICGKSFTQRSPMMLHRRTKHPEITVAPPPIKITDLLHGVKDKIITNKVLN